MKRWCLLAMLPALAACGSSATHGGPAPVSSTPAASSAAAIGPVLASPSPSPAPATASGPSPLLSPSLGPGGTQCRTAGQILVAIVKDLNGITATTDPAELEKEFIGAGGTMGDQAKAAGVPADLKTAFQAASDHILALSKEVVEEINGDTTKADAIGKQIATDVTTIDKACTEVGVVGIATNVQTA